MLTAPHFRRIGHTGLGNPDSKVVQALTIFQDHLYAGLTHHNGLSAEHGGRIVRYSPVSGTWEDVHVSPLRSPDERALPREPSLRFADMHERRLRKLAPYVPVYRGIRALTVTQAEMDPHPCLYAATVSHWGGQILRSTDGLRFDPVCPPGMGDTSVLSFRGLLGHAGKLFIATAGSVRADGIDRNFCDAPRIYFSTDPASGQWQEAMRSEQLDPGIKSVGALTLFGGWLYAGCSSYETGFQIWRTHTDGQAPFEWEPVILDGASRFVLNESPVSMAVFRNHLYIGSGLPGFGYDKQNNVGPGAAELIRVDTDGHWELVMGQIRTSPFGLQVPLSGLGTGFDDRYNSAIWSMAEHDGCLYAATNHWGVTESQKNTGPLRGGAQLWGSEDGEAWRPIIVDGCQNPYNMGIARMISTPWGLVLGISNHQEFASLARHSGPGKNLSGCEIWLGK